MALGPNKSRSNCRVAIISALRELEVISFSSAISSLGAVAMRESRDGIGSMYSFNCWGRLKTVLSLIVGRDVVDDV